MSTRRVVMWVLLGYAVAFVLPPQRLLGYFKRSG